MFCLSLRPTRSDPEPEASYNSFRHQTGFCFLQGYDTISRSTSAGVTMFVDGRVRIGVGLNDEDFRHSTSQCGACLTVESISNFGLFDDDIVSWNGTGTPSPFVAMVMDQCTDPICTKGWLDFDIYSETQPVARGNPTDLEWSFRPCPVLPSETIELLLCTSVSCHPHDPEDRRTVDVLSDADTTYAALYVRNARLPIRGISHGVYGDLLDRNGWVISGVTIEWWDVWELTLHWQDSDDVDQNRTIQLSLVERAEDVTAIGYRGGILLDLKFQN